MIGYLQNVVGVINDAKQLNKLVSHLFSNELIHDSLVFHPLRTKRNEADKINLFKSIVFNNLWQKSFEHLFKPDEEYYKSWQLLIYSGKRRHKQTQGPDMSNQGKAVKKPGSSASCSGSINDARNKGEENDSESSDNGAKEGKNNALIDGIDKNDTEPDFDATSDN